MRTLRILAAIFAIFTSATVHAAQNSTQGITVEGICHRRAVPDRGAITITAEALEKDVKSAVSKATDTYERVRSAVKKLPLDQLEVETSEYSVQEERVWENNRQVSKGFRARMGLRVTSASIQKLGEVIAVAARESVRDVGALSTYLSPEKLKQEQMSCLEEAASHARFKAEKLAGALGAKIGALVALSEARPDSSHPMPVMMKASRESMMMADAPAPQVEAGKQDISTTIFATFSLK
jgi:uncharacterized protein YggE